jgi:hypothetical protein
MERDILSNTVLKNMVVWGPAQSRRLGSILGINNMLGTCTYNCISGNSHCCSLCKNNCFFPFELYVSVRNKLQEFNRCGKKIDWIVFTGSGETNVLNNLISNRLIKEIINNDKRFYTISDESQIARYN